MRKKLSHVTPLIIYRDNEPWLCVGPYLYIIYADHSIVDKFMEYLYNQMELHDLKVFYIITK